MKVSILIPPDVDMELLRDGSNEVVGFSLTPRFNTAGSTAVLGYGDVVNKNRQPLDKFILALPGTTGVAQLRHRTKTVVALADLTEEQRKSLQEQNKKKDPGEKK